MTKYSPLGTRTSRAYVPEQKHSSFGVIMPKKTLDRVNEEQKQKSSGLTITMGSKPEGELLRVVKNYSGANTIYTSERPLIRKSGKFKNSQSSLPDWIGPGTYDSDKFIYKARPSSSYEQIFKVTGRSHRSADEIKDEMLEHQSLIESYRSEIVKTPHYALRSSATKSRELSPTGRQSPAKSPLYGQEQGDNPWCRVSTSSTIGRPTIMSRQMSPVNVKMPSHESETLVYRGTLLEMLNSKSGFAKSKGFGESASMDSKSLHSTGEGVSLDRSESVIRKMKRRDDRKYQLKDYSRGGLSLQSEILLEDSSSLLLAESTSFSPLQNYSMQEPSALNPRNSAQSPLPANVGERSNRRNSVNILLSNIERDSKIEKVSIVNSKPVKLTESIAEVLGEWSSGNNQLYTPTKSRSMKYFNKMSSSAELLSEVNLSGLLLRTTIDPNDPEYALHEDDSSCETVKM